MTLFAKIREFLAGDARRRLLLWATVASSIIGALGFSEPLDDALRMARNKVSLHKASGNVLVVGVDDRSLQELGFAPWPRHLYADLIDRLSAARVKHIYLDVVFSRPTDKANDDRLLESLKRSNVPVTFAARLIHDSVSGKVAKSGLWKPFSEFADVANINIFVSYSGIVNYLPYALEMGSEVHPSLSAAIAGQAGREGQMYAIDHSIDATSIPRMSAIDVLRGRVSRGAFTGRTVVIGNTSEQQGDQLLPRIGPTPGVYLHVLGAETLAMGRPWLAWWPLPTILAVLASVLYLFATSRTTGRVVLFICMIFLLTAPVAAERHLIFFAVCPALLLLGCVASVSEWTQFRRRNKLEVITNSISGLPNFNALRAVVTESPKALVAARVRNYADVTAALPAEAEHSLVEQIATRLTFAGMQDLYQGDEGIFAWFVHGASEPGLGDQLDSLHALFRSPVAVGDRRIDLSIAFGIDTDNTRTVPNRVASALVAADEAAGSGLRWKTFDPEQLKNADWRLSLLGRLDEAIDNGEVWVAYQPKLDLASNRITGAEALVRWTHPDKGDISPSEFVLAAEQHGRIDRLTTFVLEQAIAAAATPALRKDRLEIAVNLSARLLDSFEIVTTVRDVLKRHHLSPDRLTLEVTESATMANSGRSMEVLDALKAIGLHISIDDYGTGLSTLEYLRTIPASEIKIDRGFISLIDRNNSDKLMVSSTIQLAHSLGRRVIAEGVESANVLSILAAMGCDGAQGFFIGRPMRFDDLVGQLYAEQRQSVA